MSLSPPPKAGEYVVAEALTPATPSTAGARLNHAMLRITNPERSLAFYRDFFGMSLIFTFNTGPFIVYYLGYPGPEDTVPKDMAMTAGSRSGLLELFHVWEGPEETKLDNEQGVVGFGHLGFSVPDVGGTLKKADESGWKVLKWPENVSVRALVMPDYVQEGAFHEKFTAMFSQIGMVEDPDGYWIEVVPTKMKR